MRAGLSARNAVVAEPGAIPNGADCSPITLRGLHRRIRTPPPETRTTVSHAARRHQRHFTRRRNAHGHIHRDRNQKCLVRNHFPFIRAPKTFTRQRHNEFLFTASTAQNEAPDARPVERQTGRQNIGNRHRAATRSPTSVLHDHAVGIIAHFIARREVRRSRHRRYRPLRPPGHGQSRRDREQQPTHDTTHSQQQETHHLSPPRLTLAFLARGRFLLLPLGRLPLGLVRMHLP